MHYIGELNIWWAFICTLCTQPKAVTYTVENVGGGIGQGPATEVTHPGLNQPPLLAIVFQ